MDKYRYSRGVKFHGLFDLQIQKLKNFVVVWIKEKEEKDNKILCEIEGIIFGILLSNLIGNLTSEERDTIIDLEHKNDSLLKKLKKWLGG